MTGAGPMNHDGGRTGSLYSGWKIESGGQPYSVMIDELVARHRVDEFFWNDQLDRDLGAGVSTRRLVGKAAQDTLR